MGFDFFKKKKEGTKSPGIVEITLRYSYEWKEEVPENEKNTPEFPSRDFCVKMMEISKTKVWSRADIETISKRLGYSLWDRCGGDGCRHRWVAKKIYRRKETSNSD